MPRLSRRRRWKTDFEDQPASGIPVLADNDDDIIAAEFKVVGFIPPRETAELQSAPAREIPQGFRDDRSILNRLHTGVLVYRLDTPLYSNPAFLEWSGYELLTELTVAGGLDVLFVELGEKSDGDDGQPLRVTSNRGKQQSVEGLLFNAPWDGDTAHVLMLMPEAEAATSSALVRRCAARRRSRSTRAQDHPRHGKRWRACARP